MDDEEDLSTGQRGRGSLQLTQNDEIIQLLKSMLGRLEDIDEKLEIANMQSR